MEKQKIIDVTELKRLDDAREKGIPWKKWGPYLSERQWGTVREDYSEGGDAWNFFTHDHARSRAYRWGEDGIAGISDDKQRLCFALALWNGKDPILKERCKEIADRLTRIFLCDPSTGSGQAGRRPVYGGTERFQSDPHWRDHILFYEYFHGDNGAGLGASHQTGWTGLVAKLIQLFGLLDPQKALETGKDSAFVRGK